MHGIFVGEIQALEGAGRTCWDFETGDGREDAPFALKLDMGSSPRCANGRLYRPGGGGFPRASTCATVVVCTGGWSPAPPSSGDSSGRRWGMSTATRSR